MDNKIWPLKIYNTMSINNHGSDEEEYTLDEEIDHNQSQQWREESNVAKLFHSWNINPSNNTWRSSYQQVKIWPTLLCRHASKPYCDIRVVRGDYKPRWGYS